MQTMSTRKSSFPESPHLFLIFWLPTKIQEKIKEIRKHEQYTGKKAINRTALQKDQMLNLLRERFKSTVIFTVRELKESMSTVWK